MNVLLSHGYYLNEDIKEQEIMRPYPPLGLLYVSAYLETKDIKNTVFDSTYSSFNEQLDFIRINQPKIIALYTNLMTKVKIIELIGRIKSDPTYGNPCIILGGPDVTYNIQNYLATLVDFIIIGEGEETAFELCDAILKHKPYKNIEGIAFLENDQVIRTEPRTKIKELSTLPLPNRSAIDIHKYLKTWKRHHGASSMTVSTQRGCPYTCKWCSTAVYGQSYRRRPAKQVVEEMVYLQKKYNPDAIWFVDDVFTVSHKWMEAFFKEIETQELHIPFECITRAERLNEDLLLQLKKAGCFRIWIGAESGSQKIVDKMDRRVDIDHVKETIQMANKIGIESGTFIMVGYPTETLDDINKTIQYLKEAKPSQFTITKAYPIKGTGLYEEVKPNITTKLNWNISTDREIDFKRTYHSRFYDFAIQYILGKTKETKLKPYRMVIFKLKLTYYKFRMYLYSIAPNQ